MMALAASSRLKTPPRTGGVGRSRRLAAKLWPVLAGLGVVSLATAQLHDLIALCTHVPGRDAAVLRLR